MEEIQRGAEAIIYLDDKKVVKKRMKKNYRIDELDDSLRSQRTRREAKILEKLRVAGIPSPNLISSDDEETIEMEFIDGRKLSQTLEREDFKEVMRRAGEIVASLHGEGIVHGDLTTSNMIFKDDLYLIDFGLSFFTDKVEDKAVDVHLFKEALEAKHNSIHEEALEAFKKGYKNSSDYEKVMERLEEVEGRGRYKGK